MRQNQTKNQSVAKTLFRLFGGFAIFGLFIASRLHGKNIATLNSSGLIASQQRDIMVFAIALILTVAVPTVLILYFTAWRYRESNHHAAYHPEIVSSRWVSWFIWGLPSALVLVLAIVLIPATRHLQPNKPLASSVAPLNIQVVAMRWKWVFIYPEQHIATVNFVQIPKDVPVNFDLTANEAPMSSFWVPNLGGQLYAMTGHINRLNLMGTKYGDFPGRSAEINGAGYEGMRFTARVSSDAEFKTWVQTTRHIPSPLDKVTYDKLSLPSENSPTALYSPIDDRLFADTVMKYASSHNHNMPARDTNDAMMTDHTMNMTAGSH